MTPCPACGTASPETGERHGEYRMRRCPGCDLVFADPTRNPGAAYYETRADYAGRALTGSGRLEPAQKLFLSRPRLGPKLIDLGCGTGEFLSAARARGYEVTGLEFNRAFAERCRATGLERVHTLDAREFAARFPSERFDVATFFEVLEHNHPGEWMDSAERLLAPDGWLALSVPDRERSYERIEEGDDPPHHLTRWTAACLRRFLESRGFEIVELRSPPSRVNIAFELRNRLAFGFARRALGPAPKAGEPPSGDAPAAAPLLRAAVKLKERALDAVSWLPYAWLSAFPGGHRGSNLYCLARRRASR